MTSFVEREQAFEAKFAHDEELRFLVGARRDKLFAAWAAERLCLSDQARSELVASVLALRDGPVHDRLVLASIAAACSNHGKAAAAELPVAAMDVCGRQAQHQLSTSSTGPGAA